MKQTDYENHPVHNNLQEILNKLDEDDSSDIDVRELKAILDYMSWMLSQSDVALLKNTIWTVLITYVIRLPATKMARWGHQRRCRLSCPY